MKLKISYNNGTSKEFEIQNFQIQQSYNLNKPLPSPMLPEGPINLNVVGFTEDKITVTVTSNLIPDVSFLEKIEFVE